MFIKISSTIRAEFINTSVVGLKVAMPLKFSDGAMKVVLTTGSVLTRGVQLGECKDSSRLRLEIVESTLVHILACQTLAPPKKFFNDYYLTIYLELKLLNNS